MAGENVGLDLASQTGQEDIADAIDRLTDAIGDISISGGSQTTFPVLEMTKAQYNALTEAQKNDGTIYMITDDDGGWEAERSTYDNSDSGLSATNVQDALDELSLNKSEKISRGSNTYGEYCKMPDGTLICQGMLTLNSSYAMSQIESSGIYCTPSFYVSLPVNFVGDYVVTGTSRYSTGHVVPIGTWPSIGSQFFARVYDFYNRPLNDGLYIVRWQAIGRWK